MKALTIALVSILAAALDLAFAYLTIDVIGGFELTWPVVLLGFYLDQARIAAVVRKDLAG